MRVRAFAGSRAFYQRARVSRFCFFSCAAAHELVALSPEQALPIAVVWLRPFLGSGAPPPGYGVSPLFLSHTMPPHPVPVQPPATPPSKGVTGSSQSYPPPSRPPDGQISHGQPPLGQHPSHAQPPPGQHPSHAQPPPGQLPVRLPGTQFIV